MHAMGVVSTRWSVPPDRPSRLWQPAITCETAPGAPHTGRHQLTGDRLPRWNRPPLPAAVTWPRVKRARSPSVTSWFTAEGRTDPSIDLGIAVIHSALCSLSRCVLMDGSPNPLGGIEPRRCRGSRFQPPSANESRFDVGPDPCGKCTRHCPHGGFFCVFERLGEWAKMFAAANGSSVRCRIHLGYS
jgi:hypothetical protein